MVNALHIYCIIKNSLKFRRFRHRFNFFNKNLIFINFLKIFNLVIDFSIISKYIKTDLLFFINLKSRFNSNIKILFYKKNYKINKKHYTKFNLFLKKNSLISNQRGLFISRNLKINEFFGYIRFVVFVIRISRIFLDS